MSTPTATAEANTAGDLLPPELPDVQALARLAAEFFAALPGAAGAPGLAKADPELVPGAPVPRLESLDTSRPQSSGELTSSGFIGVPEAFAAALPSVAAPVPSGLPAAVPSTPYYFIGEGSGYQDLGRRGGEPAPIEDRVTPRSLGLPGEGELRRLLGELAAERSPVAPTGVPEAYYSAGPPASFVPPLPTGARDAFDVQAVRRDFPILGERMHGRPLV
ncbi:MAG TPA: hypothetical protein VF104_11985, partial [Burkholderiales bacterium]